MNSDEIRPDEKRKTVEWTVILILVIISFACVAGIFIEGVTGMYLSPGEKLLLVIGCPSAFMVAFGMGRLCQRPENDG